MAGFLDFCRWQVLAFVDMKPIGLRVSLELLERIDRARGAVPRERWIRGLVEEALDGPAVGITLAKVPLVTADPLGADRLARRVGVPAHLATCRCGVCRPAGSADFFKGPS